MIAAARCINQAMDTSSLLRCMFRFDVVDDAAIFVIGDFRDLPDDVARVEVSFQSPRGLNQGLHWAPFFDAQPFRRI